MTDEQKKEINRLWRKENKTSLIKYTSWCGERLYCTGRKKLFTYCIKNNFLQLDRYTRHEDYAMYNLRSSLTDSIVLTREFQIIKAEWFDEVIKLEKD